MELPLHMLPLCGLITGYLHLLGVLPRQDRVPKLKLRSTAHEG